MLGLSVHKLFKRGRKYPITRDQFGRSGRRRAFDAFSRGLRPSEVSRQEDIKPRTCFRYYQEWKKLPPDLEMNYELAKAIRKRGGEVHEDVINIVAESLDMPKWEVISRLRQPWGLKRLIMGKWPGQSGSN
jgi:hypothetical protein